VERLTGEAQILIGAGSSTTSWVLKTTVFHILDNPDLYKTLCKELECVVEDVSESLGCGIKLADVQNLPSELAMSLVNQSSSTFRIGLTIHKQLLDWAYNPWCK
jgi:hypothetical protein